MDTGSAIVTFNNIFSNVKMGAMGSFCTGVLIASWCEKF